MMKTLNSLGITVVIALLAACAHVPDAKLGYYLSRSKATLKVVRTVGCDASNNIVVVSSVTPTVTHSADRSRFVLLDLASLKGAFSDSDVKFEFYEDGRLKTVNTTIVGQGETILKTATTVIAAILGTDTGSRQFPEECSFIESAAGDGKTLTLTYEGEIDTTKLKEAQDIPPDISSAQHAARLVNALGNVSAIVQPIKAPNVPVSYAARKQDVTLQVRQPGAVQVKVTAGPKGTNNLWEGPLLVAQAGKDYTIPIPAGAVFGKQVFAAAFLESGALSSIQYARNTEYGQVLNVASSIVTAAEGKTTAQKVEDVKAEADLIMQQQRLVLCIA